MASARVDSWTSAAALGDYRRLDDAGLELDLLISGEAFRNLPRFCDRLPNLRIVINHLPLLAGTSLAALKDLAGRPKVYAKVSGILKEVNGRIPLEASYYQDSLDQLWTWFGEDRLIYGSDWPVSERFAPYRHVLAVAREYFSRRGPGALAKYFTGNARAAYRFPSP